MRSQSLHHPVSTGTDYTVGTGHLQLTTFSMYESVQEQLLPGVSIILSCFEVTNQLTKILPI